MESAQTLNIFDKLSNAYKAFKGNAIDNSIQPSETNSFSSWDINNPFFPIGFDRYDAGLKWFRSYAYACIMKKAMNVAKAEFYVYKEFKKKTNEVENHVFVKTLRNSNVYGQSIRDILVLLVLNLHLHKKAYWHIVKTDTPFGYILNEIIPLPSRYVTSVYNKDNTLIEYYDYNCGGKSVRYAKDEILEFCNFNPDSNTEGLAPIERFVTTLDIDAEMQSYAMDLFRNGANIEGFLSNKEHITDDQRKRSQAQWQAKYTGKGNRHKTPYLEGDISYTKTATTPKELDFQETRKNVRDEIFVFFDVPPSVMNVVENVNLANANAGQKSFVENTIEPYAMIMIESKINAYFRQPKWYGNKFKFTMEYEFETDPVQQLEYKKYLLTFLKPEVLAEMDGFGAEDVKEVQEPIETKEKETEEVEK